MPPVDRTDIEITHGYEKGLEESAEQVARMLGCKREEVKILFATQEHAPDLLVCFWTPIHGDNFGSIPADGWKRKS